jgi:L-rhamnose mutarotase
VRARPSALFTVNSMKRYGFINRLHPQKYEEYKRLHAAVWPDILEMIHKCGIRNYTIYHKDGFLFSSFNYIGVDFQADMDLMKADARTREWWSHTDPCQNPLESRKEGEWWAEMEELFHCD